MNTNIDKEKVNLIIDQYYQAHNHLIQGDFRIALILMDNTVEKSIKLYLNINTNNHVEFPSLLKLISKKNTDLFSNSEIDDFMMFHRIRNKYYHQVIDEKISQDEIYRLDSKTRRLISNLFNRWIEDLSIEINENIPIISEFRTILKKIEDEIILFYYDITSIYDPEKDPLKEGIQIIKDEDLISEDSINKFRSIRNQDAELKGNIEDVKDLENYTKILSQIYKLFIKKRGDFYKAANWYFETYGQDLY
ncbi:MAG: hypothetical protein ACFFG0_11355 [Candidatus Thorarchaeota archaeon]